MTRARRVISHVSTLRLLADPLKLRIYEALRDAPASPHELALRFGKRPTSLYHHFGKLFAAELIEVAETRQRRGVVERLYRPTSSQLVVDRALLLGKHTSPSVTAVLAAAGAILEVTAEDTRAAALDPSRPLSDRRRAEVATVLVRTTPAGARSLMRQLVALLRAATDLDGTGTTRVRLTLALVPVAKASPPTQPAQR